LEETDAPLRFSGITCDDFMYRVGAQVRAALLASENEEQHVLQKGAEEEEAERITITRRRKRRVLEEAFLQSCVTKDQHDAEVLVSRRGRPKTVVAEDAGEARTVVRSSEEDIAFDVSKLCARTGSSRRSSAPRRQLLQALPRSMATTPTLSAEERSSSTLSRLRKVAVARIEGYPAALISKKDQRWNLIPVINAGAGECAMPVVIFKMNGKVLSEDLATGADFANILGAGVGSNPGGPVCTAGEFRIPTHPPL
jgi:hypothetical protein